MPYRIGAYVSGEGERVGVGGVDAKERRQRGSEKIKGL